MANGEPRPVGIGAGRGDVAAHVDRAGADEPDRNLGTGQDLLLGKAGTYVAGEFCQRKALGVDQAERPEGDVTVHVDGDVLLQIRDVVDLDTHHVSAGKHIVGSRLRHRGNEGKQPDEGEGGKLGR